MIIQKKSKLCHFSFPLAGHRFQHAHQHHYSAREYLWIFQWNTAWGISSVIVSVGKAVGSSDPTVCGICKDKSIMSAFRLTLISPLIGHKGERLSKLLWRTGIYSKGKDNAFCISLIVRIMNHHSCPVNESVEIWANAVSQGAYLL